MLTSIFFIVLFLLFFHAGANAPSNELSSTPEVRPGFVYEVIGRGPLSGRLKNGYLLFLGAAVLYLLYPAFQIQNGHEVDDSLCWNVRL